MAENAKKMAAAQTEAQLQRADDQRPKRKDLSRDAGPWPGVGDATWLTKKGRLMIKRRGPFGLGSQYSQLGTWSAEPEEPVETFWTMPD